MSADRGAERVSLPKAIGWSIAFVALTLILSVLLAVGLTLLLRGPAAGGAVAPAPTEAAGTLVQGISVLVAGGLATWLIGRRVLALTGRDLRWTGAGRVLPGFAWGVLAGGLAAGLTLGIAVVAGTAAWTGDEGTLGDYVARATLTVLVLAPAALSEEVVFRGVPLVLLAGAMGRGSAVAVTSIVFALAHLANPHPSTLALGNIALAGIFLALCFYAPGGIWTAWGAHLGWNGLLAALDTPVSGLPFDIPFLDYQAGTPSWLTGGAFGPEGGLAATLALALAIPLAARWTGKEPT